MIFASTTKSNKQKNLLKIWSCAYMALLIFLCFTGCGSNVDNKQDDKEASVLKDLTYSKNNHASNVIYIQEDDAFVPFIVIDKQYEKGVLLLRQNVLDEEVAFSFKKSQGTNGGYYALSDIDAYLKENYLARLPKELQDEILDTSISVATLKTVENGGGIRETELIDRKVFLLSATELGIRSGMAVTEGKPLDYFKVEKNLVASDKEGNPVNYWLRSAYLWDDIQSWVIAGDGIYGGASVSVELSVRPAFCLPPDTPVEKSNDILSGKNVYILKSN